MTKSAGAAADEGEADAQTAEEGKEKAAAAAGGEIDTLGRTLRSSVRSLGPSRLVSMAEADAGAAFTGRRAEFLK